MRVPLPDDPSLCHVDRTRSEKSNPSQIRLKVQATLRHYVALVQTPRSSFLSFLGETELISAVFRCEDVRSETLAQSFISCFCSSSSLGISCLEDLKFTLSTLFGLTQPPSCFYITHIPLCFLQTSFSLIAPHFTFVSHMYEHMYTNT